MRFRTRAALSAAAVGATAAAALAATILPTAAAGAAPGAGPPAFHPHGDPSTGDASPSYLPVASDTPSDTPTPSVSPSESRTSGAVPGAPGITLTGPATAASGALILLRGRALLPDGTADPAHTLVQIQAREAGRPVSTTVVLDQPVLNLDGSFTTVVGVPRTTYFSARAVNTGSAGESATTKPVLVLVPSAVTTVKQRIVGSQLRVSAVVTPGQRALVDGRYGLASLQLVSRSGALLRTLAHVNITKPAVNGGNAFTFPLVPLPPAGSYIRIAVVANQSVPGRSKVVKVPVPDTPRPPARRPTPGSSPSPSPGVHTVF